MVCSSYIFLEAAIPQNIAVRYHVNLAGVFRGEPFDKISEEISISVQTTNCVYYNIAISKYPSVGCFNPHICLIVKCVQYQRQYRRQVAGQLMTI